MERQHHPNAYKTQRTWQTGPERTGMLHTAYQSDPPPGARVTRPEPLGCVHCGAKP